MPLSFKHLDSPRPGVAALSLSGAAGEGDGRRFAAAAEACLSESVVRIVLDLTDLVAVNGELAAETAAIQLRLDERGGGLAIAAPSVVVRWFLERACGQRMPPERDTVDAAAAVLAGAGGADESGCGTASAPAGRRRVRTFAPLLAALWAADDDPGLELALCDLLARTGLARNVHLARVDRSGLALVGSADALIGRDERLFLRITDARGPLTRHDLEHDGLTPRLDSFFRWSDADVVVPLHDDDALRGVLFLHTGLEAGLHAFDDGDLLALAMLGRWLADRLPEPRGGSRLAPRAALASSPAERVPEPETAILGH